MLTKAAQNRPATKPNLRYFISRPPMNVAFQRCLLVLFRVLAGAIDSDEVDSASPELERIEALPS
jgi:hypothetical protein